MKRAPCLLIIVGASLGSVSARAQEQVAEQPPATLEAPAAPSESAPVPAEQPAATLEAPAAPSESAPVPTEQPAIAPADTSAAMSLNAAPMSADELAAIGLDADAPTVNPRLELGGFMDAGFGTVLGAKDNYWRASGSSPSRSSFFVGNLNLYLHKDISSALQTTAEVRFSFLPNGSSARGMEQPQYTAADDYTDFGRPARWGSIVIQRVYIDWMPHQLLSVRVGQFLTPYGVWNVDHGSPVVISVRRPWSIGVGWIPERQTGVELFGRAELSSASILGYHLTVSNGVGPISEYSDLDENKALGARVFLEIRSLGRLKFGLSGYYGRETTASNSRGARPDGSIVSTESIKTQFDNLTAAADATWTVGGLHLQAEWLVNQRAYTDKGRALVEVMAAGSAFPYDTVSWGGYGLIGYRFSWLGIMPFVLGETARGDFEHYKLRLLSLQTGLNIRPDDSVVLKITFGHTNIDLATLPPLNEFLTQIAWSF